MTDPWAWQKNARCAGHHTPEDFFPVYKNNRQERTAKKICAGCPVRAECLESALLIEGTTGVWGGLSEEERRQVMKSRPVTRRRYA